MIRGDDDLSDFDPDLIKGYNEYLNTPDEKLPFPTKPLEVFGRVVEEYIIPDDKKAEVLEKLYIFTPVPDLDEELIDIHEDRTFIVREFRVIWKDDRNWLVSPYYHLSGGTVIDWVSEKDAIYFDEDECDEDAEN